MKVVKSLGKPSHSTSSSSSSTPPPPSSAPSTLQKLALHTLAENLPEHHPSNFSALPPNLLASLVDAAVDRHHYNKAKSQSTRTLIRPIVTKAYLLKFEKYNLFCPQDRLDNAWKCVLDEDFPVSSFDRPAIFSTTFTELVASVSDNAARLQDIIARNCPSSDDSLALQKAAMAILAKFQKLPISSKLLSMTKVGKVLQRIVSRKLSSSANISKRGHEMAASLLKTWKAAASVELETAPPPLPKTAEESQMKDSMLFSECATHRDLYLVLERRKAEIKSHTSKMKSHRDSLSSKRKATKEVTTLMKRKAAKRTGMLMGMVERDKLHASQMRINAASASGQKMSKLWRETKKASQFGRAPPPPTTSNTVHMGTNPFNGKISRGRVPPPKKGEQQSTRELKFPKSGIFAEMEFNKRRDNVGKR